MKNDSAPDSIGITERDLFHPPFVEEKMKAAAISVAVLYIYLIAWTYAVFVLDVADLGFSDTETRISL
ncbi:MAG: hypothetical protein KIG36_05320, partial [Eubacteriales bacterium]|nr:hypothetical protein [Eubacteriales bacterium]